MAKTLYMETMKIPAKRTAGQIAECLGEAGARAVLTEYDKGKITALSFQLAVGGQDLLYAQGYDFRQLIRVVASDECHQGLGSRALGFSRQQPFGGLFHLVVPAIRAVNGHNLNAGRQTLFYHQAGQMPRLPAGGDGCLDNG